MSYNNRMATERKDLSRKELEEKIIDLINQVSRLSREIEATDHKNNLDKQDKFYLGCVLAGLKHAQWSASDWVNYIDDKLNNDEI